MVLSPLSNFRRGYKRDAGTEIVLTEDITFEPLSTTTYNLKVNIIPPKGYYGMLIARTSAAKQGLNVAMCPIDPDYTGDCTAIVHNISNNKITYHKGEAFCQVVIVPFKQLKGSIKIKKEGRRSDGKLGSTGR